MSTTSSPYLRKFKVNGLHGDRNVIIDFDNSAKILLAENGSGKTTTMNLLIGVLTGRLRKDNLYEFESIEIGFASGETLAMSRTDVMLLTRSGNMPKDPRMIEVRNSIGEDKYGDLIELAASAVSVRDLMTQDLFAEADPHFMGATDTFAEQLIEIAEGYKISEEENERAKLLKETISRNFPLKVLYLPTYRRVEEDIGNEIIHRRGRPRERDQLIKFGMRDVDELIGSITEDIKRSSISSYQRTSAEMLNRLAIGSLPSAAEIKNQLNRAKDLNLVLGRLKSIISEKAKTKILEYIETEEIAKPSRQTLAFLLTNLISIYDQTKVQDERIKAFVTVVNSYLVGKEFVYDDINVRLQIFNTRIGGELSLGRLSSGEKQLVSVLAQLYLRDEGQFAVFFDEPELSLSMEWQRKILPDIISSQRCAFLLVATHSPFLFDNNLENNVSGLKIEYDKVRRQM